MAIISSPITFSSGEVISASDHNTNYGNIYTEFNGNIDNGNIRALAGIVDTKLAQITTASKVSGASLTSLASIPAAAGTIPMANIDTSNTFQTGMIILWSGSQASIPSGWYLCNGTSGTPNLTDRFVLGAGSSYAVATTGGASTHTLTTPEIPAHTHTYYSYHASGPSGAPAGGSFGTEETASTGGGGAHNNMPPYYSLCYIMKS